MNFDPDSIEKIRCPMCEQSFINKNELNRHKRTCPAKED